MKTELRLADHSVLKGHKIVEVWHDGQFIAQITGLDGSGVRIFSRHQLTSLGTTPSLDGVNLLEVTINV